MPLGERGVFLGTLALVALRVSPAVAEAIESVTKPFDAQIRIAMTAREARVSIGYGPPSRRMSRQARQSAHIEWHRPRAER